MSDLAQRLLDGDKRALARGISLVEDDEPDGWALVKEIYPHTGNAAIVGFTGPPGAGKSTLIGALIRHQRALERQVAVLSIDPSSPFRGGALLGDRIRLSEHFLDPGVFIRSMAHAGRARRARRGGAPDRAADGRGGQGRRVPGDGRRRPGGGRRDRPRGLRGAGADPGLRRLDPGAEGGRDGDPGHHRRQQVRPPADGHDGARDPRRAVAGAARRAGACRSSRRRRRAARASRSSPRSWPSTARTWRRRGRCPSAAAAI